MGRKGILCSARHSRWLQLLDMRFLSSILQDTCIFFSGKEVGHGSTRNLSRPRVHRDTVSGFFSMNTQIYEFILSSYLPNRHRICSIFIPFSPLSHLSECGPVTSFHSISSCLRTASLFPYSPRNQRIVSISYMG